MRTVTRARLSLLRPFSHLSVPHVHHSHSQSCQNYHSSLSLLWVSLLSLALSVNAANAEAESPSSHLPVIRLNQVSQHKTKETGIWVIFKDGVYDITKFVGNHPGGKDKIMLAAGGDVEPFWNIYRQHYNSPLPMELLKSMRIGTLHPDDVAAMQKEKAAKSDNNNPYSKDPALSPVMHFLQRQPINAESPSNLLGDSWITPTDMWFVRNHHPVSQLDENNFQLDLVLASDLMGKRRDPASPNDEMESDPLASITLNDLKERFPKHSIVSSIQCGGNRRLEMTQIEKTNGSNWNVSAISTAKWTGVLLRDVLAAAGITEESIFGSESQSRSHIQHIHFVSADGLEASIPIKKALSRFGDVLLAYEMNDEPLPTKHGYPLRVIVPGHVGVRNVKWVTKIRISGEEAYGPWQRGMAYKVSFILQYTNNHDMVVNKCFNFFRDLDLQSSHWKASMLKLYLHYKNNLYNLRLLFLPQPKLLQVISLQQKDMHTLVEGVELFVLMFR
jgi:sulfite oxidase